MDFTIRPEKLHHIIKSQSFASLTQGCVTGSLVVASTFVLSNYQTIKNIQNGKQYSKM
jgi:hypothetical protein